MSIKSIQGSQKLAQEIRMRRNELGLTIEEAASRAGVGTKTWCRYEAGESIRNDKYKGVCKALNWNPLSSTREDGDILITVKECRKQKTWSKYLEECFGETAAFSFSVGSDILLDFVKEDMNELARMPKGTQIGELEASFLSYELPSQFRMSYDYDFLYALYTRLILFRRRAEMGMKIQAQSVLEELLMYLIVEESRELVENSDCQIEDGWDNWIFDLFEDVDIVTCLYSDNYLTEDHCYHFKHWMDTQFWSK